MIVQQIFPPIALDRLGNQHGDGAARRILVQLCNESQERLVQLAIGRRQQHEARRLQATCLDRLDDLALPLSLQLAAGFVGFSTPSLSLLAERVLGEHLPKASRLTDWLQRPLGDAQQTYAAADVLHLAALTAELRRVLAESGRLAWAEEECEDLRARDWGPPDPEAAWLRMKEARQLRGKSRTVARSVARRPRAGQECRVVAWPVARDGRKLTAGSALLDPDGAVLAAARTLWITVALPSVRPAEGATS